MLAVALCHADSTGTGFFVSSDGYMITNHHVIVGAETVRVKHLDSMYEARIVATDPVNDVALLKAESKDAFSFLPISNTAGATPGTDVFTIGFPDPVTLGVTPKTTKGSITATAGIKDDPRFFQTSVQIQPGNSGGPLLDLHGNVVGVTTATLNALGVMREDGYVPQNVNYALKGSYLRGVFDSVPSLKLDDRSREAKVDWKDLQKATEQSVALIFAITREQAPRADPPAPDSSSPDRQAPTRPSPSTYTGNVGRLDAIFFVRWHEDDTVSGTYFYPKRGIERSYTLLGKNYEAGKLYLEEYTDKVLSAKIYLSKSVTSDQIIWSGRMENTDGRSFEVRMARER